MSIIFAAPIPGQSLTTEPKGLPFERPPKIVDPIEALDLHRFRNPLILAMLAVRVPRRRRWIFK